MPLIIGRLWIAIAIYIAYIVISWIVSMIPVVAGSIGMLLGIAVIIALFVGFIRGSVKGIGGYYSTLSDVYGSKTGRILGVVLTLVWIAVLLFLGRTMLLDLVDQYHMVTQMIGNMDSYLQ